MSKVDERQIQTRPTLRGPFATESVTRSRFAPAVRHSGQGDAAMERRPKDVARTLEQEAPQRRSIGFMPLR